MVDTACINLSYPCSVDDILQVEKEEDHCGLHSSLSLMGLSGQHPGVQMLQNKGTQILFLWRLYHVYYSRPAT